MAQESLQSSEELKLVVEELERPRCKVGEPAMVERQCRICFESDGDDLIAPCDCRGSSKFVHRECLDHWRAVKEGPAFSQCTTCKARYHLSVRPPQLGARAAKFGFLVARDSLAAFALTQLCSGFYAIAAYGMDALANGELKRACGYTNGALFYYSFGLFVFFFVAGVLGRQIARAQREHHTLVLLTVRRRRPRRRRVGEEPSTPLHWTDSLRALMQEMGDSGSDQEETPSVPLERSSSRVEQALVARTGAHAASLEFAANRAEHASFMRPSALEGNGIERGVGLLGDEEAQRSRLHPGDRRVLLRFRHTMEVTPEALIAGGCVAFFVGFLATGMLVLGVALGHLNGFFVACLAAFSVPTGLFYTFKFLRTIWESHRCILTKRMLTEEYVVQDLDGEDHFAALPLQNENELKDLGLW